MKTLRSSRIRVLCVFFIMICLVAVTVISCGEQGAGKETADVTPTGDIPSTVTDVEGPGADETETVAGPAETGTAVDPEETESDTDATVTDTVETVDYDALIETVGFPAERAGATGKTVLSVADFGAVGDGVTDDGPAISRAVTEAVSQHATLTFEAGKTYYIGSSGNTVGNMTGPMVISGASGLTIDGQGATLKVQPGLNYFSFTDCSDIRIGNFIFDYSVPVYLVGTVTSIRRGTVTMSTDIEPNLESYDFSAVGGFSIRYNEGLQQRPHVYVGQMTRKGEKTVTVDFPNGIPYAKGDIVFLPNPGVGHAFNAPVYITDCTGAIVCENVTIRAASTMSVVVNRNNAEIYFENTDLMPDMDDGRQIHMVGWRDGFHCSDNRLPIHWHNCEAGVMFDDVFNIYGALGYVLSVDGTNSVTACHWGQYRIGSYQAADIRAGDVIDFYNNTLGEYYGCATVREAIVNPEGTTTVYFEYGQQLSDIPVGAQIANRSTGAPGSTVTDCRFEGTFRFHRGLRFENTSFDILCMWIMVEDNLEGPLPGNIDFVNCTFSGPPQIDALNRGSNKYLETVGREITDIGFWGCRMEGKMRTQSQATWTTADTWEESDLYTVRNAKPRVVEAVEISPTQTDLTQGVAYDWAYHSMPVGGASPKVVAYLSDDALRTAMQNDGGFLGRVLLLEGDTLTLDGLGPDSLPCLYHDGDRVTVTLTVISDEDGTCVPFADGIGQAKPIPYAAGQPTPITVTWVSRAECRGLSLTFTGGGDVYVGIIRVKLVSNENPAKEQLYEPFPFVWTNDLRFGSGTPVLIDAIADGTVKEAVKNAPSGFTNGTVLHVTDTFGTFTGLTDPCYYTPGQRYNFTLNAYIASPTDGADIWLVAVDNSEAGYRVIAEGLFDGEGLYRFEGTWLVGDTGENALALVMNGSPAQPLDVYIGDFTVTAAISYVPSHYADVWRWAYPGEDELREGFTFDFTEGHIMDFGLWGTFYASTGSFEPRVRAALKAAGYGDLVYYLTTGEHLGSIERIFPGGHRFTIVVDAYDCIGNLAEPGDSPALVIRNIIDGEDTTPAVNYTVEVDPNDSRHLILTFVTDMTGQAPACYTTDVIFSCPGDVEMIIGSLYVRMDE